MLIQGRDEYTMASEEVSQQAIDDLVLAVIGEDSNWTEKERMQFSTSIIDSISHEFAVNITKEDQRLIVNGGKDSNGLSHN
jgi:hypothetical protein